MNWKNGFSSSYYAYIIDPKSWRETERFEITGGSITRSDEGLRDSADIDCTEYENDKERYVRIYRNKAHALNKHPEHRSPDPGRRDSNPHLITAIAN